MSSRSLTVLVALLLAGGVPAAHAAGPDTGAPAGLSGADQYLETIPGSAGNGSVGNGQRPSLDDPDVRARAGTALPPGAARALSRRGRSGASAAALAARTAPRGSEPATTADVPAEGSPRAPLATLRRVATGAGDDGLGLLFPLALVAGTVVVAGSALRRRGEPAT